MAFERTRDALSIFENQGEISVENLLGFFVDFCDDIGTRVEQLKVQEPDQYLKNMRRCGRILQDIMNSRDTSSLKAEALEKLNQRKERLELQDALLTAELSDLEKSDASEIERHIREAQQKKSELQAAREEKNRILSRLAEENVVLEQQIQAQNAEEETVRKDAEKKKTQIALFDSHKKDLEEELSGIIQENNLLAQKINHELNPALQKAREDAGVYREAIGKVQNELQQLTEENESSAALIESLTAKVKEGEAKREEQNRSMEEMTEQYQKN